MAVRRTGGLHALWEQRVIWLGPLAWVIAFVSTVLLADEATRTRAEVLLIVAAALAVVAWGFVRPPPAFGPRSRTAQRLDARHAACLFMICLAAVATWSADSAYLQHPEETFGRAGILWLFGMVLLLGATLAWPRPTTAEPSPADKPSPAHMRRIGVEPLIFAGLVVLAVVLRVWDLRDLPYAIHPDEILTGRVATQAYLNGSSPSVFGTLWDYINLPALWFLGVAATLKLGGITLAVLRLPAALFGAATVIPFYGLVREAWGRVAAVFGTAVLAFSAADVQYSRVTLNNIVTPFFWTICFYFVLRGLRTRRPADWALAGLAAGLSEYSYYGTRLLPFLLLAFGGYLLIVHWREGWRYLGHFALLALGYLAAFGPLLAYFTRNPTLYFGRGLGVLMWDHIPRDWADLQLMWNTLWPIFATNLLGISTQPDQSTVYWAPLLLPAEAALLTLGVGLLLWRWRQPASFLILLWGVGVLFVGGTLVRGIPFLAHWTPAFPAFYAALALPIGLWQCGVRNVQGRAAGTTQQVSRFASYLMPTAIAAALVILGWANIDFYFTHYQVIRPEFEIRAAQSRWEAALGTGYRVRVVGPTWQPYDPETNQYLITGQDAANINGVAGQLPLPLAPGKGLAFVFFPDSEQYLDAVRAIYPGGTLGAVPSHVANVQLFTTYVLTPAQAAAAPHP